jgi:CheY-like chemotaxis protein
MSSPETRHLKLPHSRKVALVEDEADLNELYCLWLSEEFQVLNFHSGPEFRVALASGYTPDLLITDFLMEKETGLDLIAQCKHLGHSFPSLVVTGSSEIWTSLSRGNYPVAGVLMKPFGALDLVRATHDIFALKDMCFALSQHQFWSLRRAQCQFELLSPIKPQENHKSSESMTKGLSDYHVTVIEKQLMIEQIEKNVRSSFQLVDFVVEKSDQTSPELSAVLKTQSLKILNRLF